MAKVVTPRELATYFLTFLSRYAYREELDLLGLAQASQDLQNSFKKYYSSLLVLLWSKALRSAYPKNHKDIYAVFLERYSTILAREAGNKSISFDYQYLSEFLELSKKKDGLVFIASFFASMTKRSKQEQLAVTKRILKRILQHLKYFADLMHGTQLDVPGAPLNALQPLAAPLATSIEELVNKVFFTGPQTHDEIDIAALLDDDSQVPNSVEDTQLDVKIPGRDAGQAVATRNIPAPGLPALDNEKPIAEVLEVQAIADEFLDGEGLEIEGVDDDERRTHSRLPSINARILLENTVRELPVRDVSLGGVAIQHEGWRFKEKDTLCFDLIHRYKVILTSVQAQVVRKDNETIGCEYLNLAPEQKAVLESYLLALTNQATRTKAK